MNEYEHQLLPALLRWIATERTDAVATNALTHAADALERMPKLVSIGARLAACMWDYQETCPECGNRKASHMAGCKRTYEEFTGPRDAERVFAKAFGIHGA